MAIWDDFKARWQWAGTALAQRSKVNVIDRKSGGPTPAILTNGDGRVDFTPPETSPLYIFSTQPAPFSATGDDLWLAPYGQLASATAISTPIARRQYLSIITFHIVSTPLTDSVDIDVHKNNSLTGLTLNVPANTNTSAFLVSAFFPVVFDVGDDLQLRLRQNGTALQAAWNAYIVVG
jgi:hypothetical protein